MKQVIRNNVFETNSSSMHSLSIRGKDNIFCPAYPLDGTFGEFGWGNETYSDYNDRLSYLLTAIVQSEKFDNMFFGDDKEVEQEKNKE